MVEPSRTRSPPPGILYSCVCRDVRKAAISVVVIKNAARVAENEQVGEAVIVVVADGNAHAEESLGADPGLSGDISERSVAVVAVESASQRLFWGVDASCGAIHQVQRSEEHTSELQSPCNL